MIISRGVGPKSTDSEGRIVYGALSGTGIIVAVELSSLQAPDRPLYVALLCFSVVTPIAAAMFLLAREEEGRDDHEGRAVHRLVVAAALVSLFLGFAGLSALFFHFSNLLGSLFVLSACFAILVFGKHLKL